MSEGHRRTTAGQRQATLANKKSQFDGHWAVAFGTDEDGIRRAFRIRIDERALGYFPKKLVLKGVLEPYSKREEWVAEQKFDYFDGRKINDAIFFRHCYSNEDLEEAFSECSAYLGVEDDDKLTANEEESAASDNDSNSDARSTRETSPINRLVGSNPLTTPVSTFEKATDLDRDPDYVPLQSRRKRARFAATFENARVDPPVEKSSLSHKEIEPMPYIADLIRSLQQGINEQFNVFGKQISHISKRLSNIETLLLEKERCQTSTVSAKKPSGLFTFGKEFFKEGEHSFVWMGVDVRSELNLYVSTFDVDLSKASTIVRRLAEHMLGVHNHYHFRLSVSDRNKTDCRSNYCLKDPDGDSLIKYVLLKVAVEMKVAIKRLDCEDEADAVIENYRSMLMQSESVMKHVVRNANQLGLDFRKTRPVEKKSLYWSLIDNGVGKPTPTWTIFEECALENASLKPASLKSTPTTSMAYRRMLELADKTKKLSGDQISKLKSEFDDFGVAL